MTWHCDGCGEDFSYSNKIIEKECDLHCKHPFCVPCAKKRGWTS